MMKMPLLVITVVDDGGSRGAGRELGVGKPAQRGRVERQNASCCT